jgi:hypothetical protein
METEAQEALPVADGSAQLTSTGNVTGFEIFRWTTFGQEASVPLETRTPGEFVLVFDNTNGLTTGVALANTDNSAVTLNVQISDDAGTLLQTGSVSLPARGHQSFMLPANFPLTTDKRGVVEFAPSGGGRISIVGLRAKADGTLTTVPVLAK